MFQGAATARVLRAAIAPRWTARRAERRGITKPSVMAAIGTVAHAVLSAAGAALKWINSDEYTPALDSDGSISALDPLSQYCTIKRRDVLKDKRQGTHYR
jgi:hypothetical protein